MRLRRLHPDDPESIDLEDPGSRARLLDWYAAEPDTVRINLVASITGSAVGTDGTSESLTNRTDRRILGVIRELSDVVLVGAASVRAEGYQVPKRSSLAIVTATGDLEGHRIETTHLERVLVVCASSVAGRVERQLPGARVAAIDSADRRLEPAAILGALRASGLRSVVCEGGPSLAGALVAANLVDELCLTTSPRIGDVTMPILGAVGMPERSAVPRHILTDDEGYVFTRWAVQDR